MNVNKQFEKDLLLLDAEEDSSMGIYELILYQLSFYKEMKLGERYDLASQVLLELIEEEKIIIEEFESNLQSKKTKEYNIYNIDKLKEVLNTPQYWHINNNPHLIYRITEKGEKYLDAIDERRMNMLKTRFYGFNH